MLRQPNIRQKPIDNMEKRDVEINADRDIKIAKINADKDIKIAEINAGKDNRSTLIGAFVKLCLRIFTPI